MSKTGNVPKAYTPTWQAGADQSYQGLVQNALPWATALPGQVIPGLNNAAQNVANNPYYPGAQSGANDVSAMASGSVAPAMFDNAQMLNNRGRDMMASGGLYSDPVFSGANAAYGRGSVLSDRAADMIMPALGDAFQMAPVNYASGMNKANKLWNETQMAIPGLTGGMDRAHQMLDNGFDPQGALYDREFQKMQDQQNAINAMYGVSSSPYGAGVAGDQARNFNIDWQNNQLGRQLSALQGFGNYQSGVTGNLTSLLGTGAQGYTGLSNAATGQYNDLMNSGTGRANTLMNSSSAMMNQGVDNQRQGYATGFDIVNGANRGATDLMGAASNHAADGLNTLYTSTQLPSQTYLNNQQAQIAALQALAAGGNTALGPTSDIAALLSNYMRLGQGATALNQQASQIKSQNQAGFMQGLGSLVGQSGMFNSLAGGSGGGFMDMLGSIIGPLVGMSPEAAAALTASMGPVVSDRRAKEGLVLLHRRPDGAGVYSYRYKGEDEQRIGVIAQEIRKTRPDVVSRMPNGYLAVDYGKLAA